MSEDAQHGGVGARINSFAEDYGHWVLVLAALWITLVISLTPVRMTFTTVWSFAGIWVIATALWTYHYTSGGGR